ncbi:MAG: hypothetical protein AAF223_18830, partial [Bacteroidota bacterium]
FNLKGRKWVDRQGVTKYFNSLQAWRIQPATTEAPAPPPAAETPAPSSSNNDNLLSASDEEDDLPF